MIFNSFQREDDDAVFTVGKNVEATAYAVGDVAVLDSGAAADGVRFKQAAAATLGLFRGVAVEVIPASGFGKIQVHGYNSNAKVDGAATAGDNLVAVAAQRHLASDAPGDGLTGFVYAIADTTGVLPALSRVFIRAL